MKVNYMDKTNNKKSLTCLAALAFGIVSICGAISAWIVGVLVGIIGLFLSIKSIKEYNNSNVSLILNCIGIILSIVAFLLSFFIKIPH